VKTLLLDTNVVSYLMRGHALGRAYRPLLANHALAVSFMTVAELYEGAYRNNWGTAMRHALDKNLASAPKNRSRARSFG